MSTVAIGVASVTLYALYHTAFEQQRERLIETAKSRARILEAVLHHEEQYSPLLPAATGHGEPLSATLEQVRESHRSFTGFGSTGEFTLARLEDDQIVFLLSHRHDDLGDSTIISNRSSLAEPMRRALSGISGTVLGLDYRGARVLAAHEPVAGVNLGVVAKIDLAEIRSPFLRAGILAGSIGLVFITLGIVLFLRIGTPMVRKIEESERKYRGLFESAADILLLIDRRGIILDGNPTSCSSYGYSKAGLIGRHVSDIIHADFHHLFSRALTPLSEGRSFQADSVDVRQDGTPFNVEVRLSPLHVEDKEVILAAVRDVTERKRIEETLRSRTHDLGERVKELNCLYGMSELAATPGISLHEMLERMLALLPPAWQYPEITCVRITIHDEMLRSRNFKETPWRQASDISVDGDRIGAVEVFYLEERPGADEGPFLREERNLIEAVSERLAARIKRTEIENALQSERDNLACIFDSMKDGVYVAADNHDLEYVSPALEKDFGPWRGQKCFEYFGSRKNICPWCQSGKVFCGQTTRWEWYSPRTEKTYELIGTPLKRADGSISNLEMFRDITERKSAEGELRELNEKLEERVAERTVALEERASQLRTLTAELAQAEQHERQRLAQVLHDHIQQMLFGAKMQAEALKKTDLRKSDVMQAIGRIEKALADSIKASRELTVELYPPILQSEELTQVIEWLVSWMQEQHGLTVEFRSDTKTLPIAEDVRVVLFQAIRELLFNVKKHAKVDRAKLKISRVGEEQIQVIVSDHGAGFDPGNVHRMKNPCGGFGLFNVRERLEFMGGRLELESQPGLGSSLRILVPIRSMATNPKSVIGSDASRTTAPRRPQTHQPSIQDN